MKLNFFRKCYKFNIDYKNVLKRQQNVFGFSGNYIWSSSGNLSLLGRKYTWFGVNVLTASTIQAKIQSHSEDCV